MSLIRLATEARRAPQRKQPGNQPKIQPEFQPEHQPENLQNRKNQNNQKNIEALTKYIPTESITLYVATLAALPAIATMAPWFTPSVAYWLFAALTPVLLLVLRLRQSALDGKNWKVPPSEWPIWRMVASTIAFLVWALAVPGNAVASPADQNLGVIAGFAAATVSWFLNLIEPFVEPPSTVRPRLLARCVSGTSIVESKHAREHRVP